MGLVINEDYFLPNKHYFKLEEIIFEEKMALLPITLYGDSILRKKTQALSDIDNKTIKVISNMFETMYNARGIGLAANQIGLNKSIFIVDLQGVEGYDNFKPLVFINPEIKSMSEEKIKIEEGCLSIPEIKSEVERPAAVEITYLDAEQKELTIQADSFLARVIQHEYDHLRGIYFTDLLSQEEQKKIKKSLARIKSRRLEIDYPFSPDQNYRYK